MTTIALDREQTATEQSSSVLKIISILLMVIGLIGAVSLLNWAVTNKLSRTEVTETSQVTAEMRERQLGCLAKNIYHEAGGEPFEGKVAVAQVTLNRTNSGKFPGDVCKTIYQKNIFYEKVVCQFSWTCDRDVAFRPTNRANYNESMIAAQKVLLEDYRLPSLKNALFYHADYINPNWGKKPIAHIGRHIFYN
jgi:spore germination cell wall hydrolase CwlJ-like protein